MGIVYFISAAHYDGNIFYVWNAVGMGLFLCGCLAHYGPGRLTGIALWTYSLIGSIALHRISFSIGYLPVASLIISLLFFMPGGAMNFKTLFNKHYIFPPGTDVTFSSKSLSATILLNLKIIGEFISPIRSKRFSWSFMYGSYSAYVHSFTWLHLVLLALGACVFWFSVNCYIIGVFTLLFLSLLIPCAISAWYENNIPTLSNFRLFYLTMPMFLLMGCGLKWLFAFHILPLTLIVGLICAFTFAFDIQNLFREMKDFEGATIQLAGMTPLMLENTLAKMDETSPKEEEYQGIDHLHMFQQLVLLAKSKQIRDAIDKWDKSSKRLLMLPSFDLDQKSSLPYFLDIPHSLLFLVFYLQDLKIPCACLQLFDTRISGARIINGSGYIGAPRLFPIRWDNLNMNNITETTNLIVRPERDDCQNLFIASHVIEQECVQLTFPDIVSETLS